MGGMTEMFARWAIERGDTLGRIEQLHGSSTLASTIIIAFRLRSRTFLTLFLIGLWALSPLGGQASLRIINVGDSTIQSATNVWYLLSNQTSTYASGSEMSAAKISINGIFLASLLASEKDRNASMDTFGNLKIPFLEGLKGYNEEFPASWVEPEENPMYSSIIGIPIVGHSNEADTMFQMESSYFYLDCPIVEDNSEGWSSKEWAVDDCFAKKTQGVDGI